MRTNIRVAFVLCFVGLTIKGMSQKSLNPSDPEYYAMDRQQMRFDDYQVMLINYRGFACPRQYSITGFTNVQFLPLSAPSYNFNLNFFDHSYRQNGKG